MRKANVVRVAPAAGSMTWGKNRSLRVLVEVGEVLARMLGVLA